MYFHKFSLSQVLYSAISPLTGKIVNLIGFSRIDSITTEAFLNHLKQEHPDEHLILIWDKAPFHRKKSPEDIEGLSLLALLAYSPQLHPVERFFDDLRKTTANRIFTNLEEQTKLISQAIIRYSKDSNALKRLTAYPWVIQRFGKGVI